METLQAILTNIVQKDGRRIKKYAASVAAGSGGRVGGGGGSDPYGRRQLVEEPRPAEAPRPDALEGMLAG